MESHARLDYVLFHLTPTRTRCDLVIFARKSNEKLAYGLLEPFTEHLRSAKDQISKGGYSVTLRPPPSTENSNWFTKGTLQRFVRFVSTPEVLERFVTIEREILQLENSIKSFEASNAGVEAEGNGGGGGNSKTTAVPSKSYGESNDGDDLEQEENSKARLHRVVETRKVVLCKEQAMVYARALAAGFEMDNLNDLLLFSDAFGASRLREACVNFRDLCKKKNKDRHWVDEIAAMQALMQPDLSFLGTSGVVLAGDDNDPLIAGKPNGSADNSMSDSTTTHGSSNAPQASQTPGQMLNPRANQFPAYLRNFQGPMFQQMPPYQGYGFPGMQVGPPYYPANMSWPSGDHDSHGHRDHKTSSKKKTKASKARESGNGVREENTETGESSTDTDSSSDTSHRKKNGKKSSRRVVIRNINYISSKRDGEKNSDSERNSSDEEESFEKHHKSMSRHHKKRNGSSVDNSADQNGNKGSESWDAFQQLLLKEDSDTNVPEAKISEVGKMQAFTPEVDSRTNPKALASDAFLVTDKGTESYVNLGKISDERLEHNEGYHPVMRRGSTPEVFPFSQSVKQPESYERVSWSDDAARSSVIKTRVSDDWIVRKQSDEAVNEGELGHLMLVDGTYVICSADQVEKRNKDAVIDDSLMIQGRLADDCSNGQLHTDITMVSDMIEASFVEKETTDVVQEKVSESQGFYEPDEHYMVLDRNTTVIQTVPSWNAKIDFENSLLVNNSAKKSDTDATANLNSNEKVANKKSVTKASSKDARSRTSGGPNRRGKPETTPVPRRSTFGSKTNTPKSQLQKDEERRKRMEELLVRRQKRIAERASGNSATASLSSDKSKRQQSAEETKKPKAVLRSSTIDRLAVAKKAPNSPTIKPKREASKLKDVNVKRGSQKNREDHVKKNNVKKIDPLEENLEINSVADVIEAKPNERTDKVDDSTKIKELHVTSSTVNNDEHCMEQTSPDEKEHSMIPDDRKNDDEMPEKSVSFPEEIKVSDNHDKLSIQLVPDSPTKNVISGLIIEGNAVTNSNIGHSPQSTPLTTNETIFESIQSRKKWEGPENSPKSVKGFRKLLMFARRS